MTIQKFFTSRVKQTTGSTYVGEKGRIFYDETIKSLRVSDGHTPGGTSILFTTLSANIGDLYVTGGNISSMNANEDINLITNGTGNVKIIGELLVTQTDGTPLIDSLTNGTINFYVPVQNTNDSGIDIIGTPNKAVVAPQNVGVMLHVTGQPSLPSRLYNDGANAYAFFGGRRYNGTADAPTAVQSNTLVTRYGSTPYNSSGWPTVSTTRIEMYSTEVQTSTNQGSNIALWTTPIGSNTITQVASIDNTGLTVTGNLSIGTSGRITTPKVIINNGGIRTISGGTTCTIDFSTDSIILWTAPSGTAAITLSNYTPGTTVKLIIALTTTRDVTYGISSAANSSTGADNWNGSGAGAVDISNTAMHLNYTCISAVAGGCYVAVIAN